MKSNIAPILRCLWKWIWQVDVLRYWKTHSIYFNLLTAGELKNEFNAAHIIEANGYKGKLGSWVWRNWLQPYPSVWISRTGSYTTDILFEIRFLTFILSFWIVPWKR